MSRKATFHTLLAGLIFLAGCRDEPSPAGPETPPERPSASVAPGTPAMPDKPSPENASQRLARLIPQFGGAFVSDGVLNVYLTDLGAADQARSVVRQELDTHGRRGLQVRFVHGTYSYRQLEAWRMALLPLFGTEGVVSLGIRERENRVGFGPYWAGCRSSSARDSATTKSVHLVPTLLTIMRAIL